MNRLILIVLFAGLFSSAKAQLYFPPNNSSVWDTISPASLGWCQTKIDSLYQLLDTNSTRAFLLLKDGKIVLEKYFNGHAETSNWYWASAGKTLTAFMVGLAQEDNYLNITDTTSTYLGQGWTVCSPTQESRITIRHQLTMTSGLDDDVADPYCTLDSCLHYLADAGTRWAYHNAPYTLLEQLIENATAQSLNLYTTQKVKTPTGMDGLYIQQGYNNVFFSTARSMARFGLLILNHGNWDGNQIMTDTNYFHDMVNTSQDMNESYGYLWWLNGKSSFMIPQTQFVFNGSMQPNAPNDMIAAIGKNGQFINVVPSQNMVWIRMGDAPDNSLVPFTFNNDIWAYLNDLECNPSGTEELEADNIKLVVYPNPVDVFVRIKPINNITLSRFEISNSLGQIVKMGEYQNQIDVSSLSSGIYCLRIFSDTSSRATKLIKR